MPIYEIETDQGIFEIDADREPTPEEAMQAISAQSLETPATRTPSAVFTPSQSSGPVSQAFTNLGDLINAAVIQPARTIGRGAAGLGEVLGEASTEQPSISQSVLAGINPLMNSGNRNIVQSALEAGGRGVFDLGMAIRDAAGNFRDRAVANPLETALSLYLPQGEAIRQLVSPTQVDPNTALERELLANQVEAVKSQPLVPEIIGDANIPLAEGLEVAGALSPGSGQLLGMAGRGVTAAGRGATRAITSPIQTARNIATRAIEPISPTVAARIAPATVEQSAMAALDLDRAAVQQHIPIVTQRVSSIVGKVPKTADEAISFLNQAEKQLYDERLEFVNAAEKQGLVAKGDVAIKSAQDLLEPLTTVTNAQKKTILERLKDLYSGDKTPTQGQKIQRDLNDKFSAAYENGTIDRADASFQAEKAIRDSFAGQMDEIVKATTGINETPYSDIGSIIEVKGSLTDKLRRLEGVEAARKTGIESSPGRLPTTKVGAASKVTRKALTPFQKTQIEKLNENVSRIFQETPATTPALPLEQSIMDQLRQAQSPGSSLEAQIRERIQTYPRNIRSDPVLARLVAESELGLR